MTCKKNGFLWNFSLECTEHCVLNSNFSDFEDLSLEAPKKWEKRFFWDATENITLKCLGDHFLNFNKYKFKSREDCYFLSPTHNKNIKFRHRKLAYKPLLETSERMFCYDKKVKFDLVNASPDLCILFPELSCWNQETSIREFLMEKNESMTVYKEAFIYVFSERFSGKFELSRILVNGNWFLSFCLEAKNKKLVKYLTDQILPDEQSIDYISFLKDLKL